MSLSAYFLKINVHGRCFSLEYFPQSVLNGGCGGFSISSYLAWRNSMGRESDLGTAKGQLGTVTLSVSASFKSFFSIDGKLTSDKWWRKWTLLCRVSRQWASQLAIKANSVLRSDFVLVLLLKTKISPLAMFDQLSYSNYWLEGSVDFHERLTTAHFRRVFVVGY